MRLNTDFRTKGFVAIGLFLAVTLTTGCSSSVSPPPNDDTIKVYGKKIDRDDIEGEPVMSIEAPSGITVGEFLNIRAGVPSFSKDVSCQQALATLRDKGFEVEPTGVNELVAIEPVHKLKVTYRFPDSTCHLSSASL